MPEQYAAIWAVPLGRVMIALLVTAAAAILVLILCVLEGRASRAFEDGDE